MPGYVELLTLTRVKGWAHDPTRNTPAAVKLVLDQNVIAEGIADLPREDVAKALKSSGRHGFDIRFAAKLSDADLPRLTVLTSSGSEWTALKRTERATAPRRSYQDFDGSGSSKSREKLKLLRLGDLPRPDPKVPPLHGKAVLDLGCNEGFFCIEAVRQGASRVVGIDMRKEFIESARNRCPEATFIHGSWWKLPDEKFDCILFLSAIHYEKDPRGLLRKLREHLTPRGVLILECGVVMEGATRAWRSYNRWDGVKRYPTLELLMRNLLADYAVRPTGPSVNQAGDPVPRYVYHCTPLAPVAMIIGAPSLSGKTNLSFQLEGRGVPTHSIDTTLARLVVREDQRWRPLAAKLIERFGAGRPANLSTMGNWIVENGLEDELCEIIVSEAPLDISVFCIQGEALRHASVQDSLKKKLVARNIRPWLVAPL